LNVARGDGGVGIGAGVGGLVGGGGDDDTHISITLGINYSCHRIIKQ